MRLALVLLPLIAAPALAHDEPPARASAKSGAGVCENSKIHQADRNVPVRAHPLGQEPGARQEIAVLRSIDGCIKPIVVREDVGGKSR
jgi:hypothetical protein